MLWLVGSAYGAVTNTTTGASYATISAAVADAVGGDTLEIGTGTYTEQVVVDRDLTLLADPATTLVGPVGVTDVLVVQAGASLTVHDLVVLASLNDTNQRPLHVEFGAGDVTLEGCGLVGLGPMDPGTEGGAVLAETFGSLTLRDTTLSAAAASQGAALSATSTDVARPPVVLDHVTVEVPALVSNLEAVYGDHVALTVTDSSFGPLIGPAAYTWDSDLTVLRSAFCGVEAIAVWGESMGTAVVENNVFSGAVELMQLYASDGDWVIRNNAFLETSGMGSEAVSSAEIQNNVFVSGPYGLGAINNTYVHATYNWFHDVDDDIPFSHPDPSNQQDAADPRFVDYTPDGDCANDDLWLQPVVSPLIDAGDPAILDPDGSISDIGPFGGPEADPAAHADNDGDGATLLHDCDDGDATIGAATTFYQDCDGDGEGDPLVHTLSCAAQPDAPPACGAWVTVGTDCDDANPAIYAGADETCARGDSNCDGDPDLGAIDAYTYFVDGDGDGYGGVAGADCKGVPDDGVAVGGDCDDADPLAYPGASDACDGVDQDCDGLDGTDGLRPTWYADGDGDGYGDPLAAQQSCDPGPGWVSDDEDCDDSDGGVYPGRPEVCDAVDQDCNGSVDDGLDCAEDANTPKDPGGCGCAVSPTRSWGLALLLAAATARRRRP
jgi:MYXO-CTERM domain-containing protein